METWLRDVENAVVEDWVKNERNNEMSGVKHVVEHQYKPNYPYHLPQMESYPMPVPAAVPQQVIQRIPVPVVPQPVYQNLVPPAEQPKGSMFNKNDFMEMMMVQHQQMHQMMLQQMMLRQMGGGPPHHHCAPSVVAEPVVVPRASGQVHHHHYGMSPAPSVPQQPVVHHYSQLPAIDGGRMLSPARGERRIIQAPSRQQRTRSVSPPPVARKRSNQGNRPSSVFLFGIILKEIVAALHRIYLNPSGNIYPVLADIISPKAYDLTNLLRGRTSDRENQIMIQELCYVVENLCYHITEIMPSTGVLGTHRKSAAFELIRDGKRFPDGYFWQVELDRLHFTENGRTIDCGDEEAFLLIVGIYISRSLITTLLMKPVDYGLSSAQLTDVAERNLKILATTMLFLVRRVSIARGRAMMPMPSEIAKYLYTDEEMRPIYTKMGKSFNYSEGLLREWGQEYIKRLRAAPVPK